ncbi:MAG: ABC transporter permease [Patescibacteria group bacterium]|nr:ABC transporter permease [Patescibacteria group bacterium]
MQFSQIFKISLRSLRTNKVRSFLTMLGVIIGVSSVIMLVAIGSGLQKYVTDQLEGIGSNLIMVVPGKMDLNKMGSGGGGGGLNFLNSKLKPEDAQSLVQQSPLIVNAVSGVANQAAVKYEEQKMYVEVQGHDYNFYEVMNSPLKEGDYFTEGDEKDGRKVAILGSEVAKKLYGNYDPLGEKVIIADDRFTVTGVLKDRGVGSSNLDDNVVIPRTTAQRLFNQQNVAGIYAQAVSADKMDLAIADVKIILLNRLTSDDFTIMTQKDLLGAVSSILGMLTLALAGIAAISLLVGGIGIMNIMLVSVTERTREIGLRKALGATPSLILTQFLIEAVVLSVGGGLLGILLGASVSLIISKFAPVQLTWWAISLAFLVSAGVGIIFGVMPARRAAKLNPIEALRYE